MAGLYRSVSTQHLMIPMYSTLSKAMPMLEHPILNCPQDFSTLEVTSIAAVPASPLSNLVNLVSRLD